MSNAIIYGAILFGGLGVVMLTLALWGEHNSPGNPEWDDVEDARIRIREES